MIHEVGREGKTLCCQVCMTDLPIEDHVTFYPEVVTCQKPPVRNPEQMAEFYQESLHRSDPAGHQPWSGLSPSDRNVRIRAAGEVLNVLHL